MKKLILVDPRTKRKEDLLFNIVKTLAEDSAVILPTARTAKAVRSELSTRYIITGTKFLNKEAFLRRLIEQNLSDYEIVDFNIQTVILSDLIRESRQRPEYLFLEKYDKPQIQRIILRYFSNAIMLHPDDPAESIENEEIRQLYQIYLQFLEQNNLLSYELALQKMAELDSISTDLKEIVLDNIYFFSPLELKVFEFLFRASVFENTIVLLEYVDDVPGLAFAEDAYRFYRRFIDDEQRLFEPEEYTRFLFSRRYHKPIDTDSQIEIWSFPEVESEVETIAKEIKRLIIDGVCSPGDITVLPADLGIYQSKIESIFTELGLPYDMSKGYELQVSPFLSLIMKYLRIRAKDWLLYQDVYDILMSSYVSIDKTKFPDLNKFILNSILVHTNLLRYRKTEFFKKVEETISEDINKTRLYFLADEEIKRQAIHFFRKLKKLFKTINEEIGVEDFIEYIFEFLGEFKIQSHLFAGLQNNILELERNIHILTSLENTFRELINMMRFSTRPKRSFADFVSLLKNLIYNSEYHFTPKPYAAVKVMGLFEYRGHYSRYVFVLGAVEDNLPSYKYGRVPFSFMDYEFRRVMDENKYIFTNLLYRFSDKLILSYYERADDKEMIMSQYLEELRRAVSNIKEKGLGGAQGLLEEVSRSENEIFVYSRRELAKLVMSSQIAIDESKIAESFPPSFFEIINKRINIYQRRAYSPIQGIKVDSSGKNVAELKRVFNEYEGNIGPELSIKLMEKYKYRKGKESEDRGLGAYDLEDLVYCPMKFFFEKLLGIYPVSEPIESPESRMFGTVMHEIFYEFYREWYKRKKSYKITESQQKEAILLIEHITRKLFEEKLKPYFVNPAFFSTYLYRYIGSEHSKYWVGRYIYYAVKLNSEPIIFETEYFINFMGYLLKARVDRIDQLNDKPNVLEVIDYKKDSMTRRNFDKYKINIQIPFYLWLVNSNLSEAGKLDRVKKGYIIGYEKYSIPQSKSVFVESDGAVFENILTSRFEINIKNGLFYYTQSRYSIDMEGNNYSLCNRCNYKDICFKSRPRIEEEWETQKVTGEKDKK